MQGVSPSQARLGGGQQGQRGKRSRDDSGNNNNGGQMFNNNAGQMQNMHQMNNMNQNMNPNMNNAALMQNRVLASMQGPGIMGTNNSMANNRDNRGFRGNNMNMSSDFMSSDSRYKGDEDDFDEDQQTDIKAEELKYFRLDVPVGVSEIVIQRIIDSHYYPTAEGGSCPPKRAKRRRYDNKKLQTYFSNGPQVYNRLMRNCRRHFARYFYIWDEDINILIDKSIDTQAPVDRDGDAFHEAYTKVCEWRKNWHAKFAKVVDGMLETLTSKHPDLKEMLPEELPEAYAKFFSFETMYTVLGQVQCIVDLRACMLVTELNWFYESLFSWSLTYAHMTRFGTGTALLSRTEYLRRLRLIGHQKQFDCIADDAIIFLPEKPVPKLRNTPLKKGNSDDVLEGFSVLGGGTRRQLGTISEIEGETSSLDPALAGRGGRNAHLSMRQGSITQGSTQTMRSSPPVGDTQDDDDDLNKT